MESQIQTVSEEKKILQHSAFYSFSIYFRIVFRLLGGIIIAKQLGPALYGFRNMFGLAVDYESYSDLGTFLAMAREVPYSRGEKDENKAHQIISSAFGINFIYALVVGFFLVFASFYLRTQNWEETYIDFVFYLGLIIITNKLKRFYINKLVFDKKVFLLSRAEMIYGFSSTILCVALVFFFSFKGVLIGLFTADIIYIGYILMDERRLPSISISFPLIWELLKIGFPMMIVLLLLLLLQSTDRIMIIAMLTEEDLGYFGIATIATGVIFTIPMAVYQVLIPRLMEKLGSTKDIYRVKNFLIEPTVIITYFIPFLLSLIYLTIHLPIQYFLNQFMPSISIVKILTLGLFFYTINVMPISICYALNKQLKIIYIALPSVLFSFAINYLCIHFGWGLNGIAFGMGITNLLFSSFMVWYAFKQYKAPLQEILKFFLLICAPFIYTLFLILIIDIILDFNTFSFWSDLIYTTLKIIIFFLSYSLIFILVRKNPAINKFFDILPFKRFIPHKLIIRFSNDQ